MPLLEPNEIRKQIQDRRIGAITLDTCVYKHGNYRLENGFFRRLANFAISDITFLLVDVIREEMRSDLIEEARAARTAVRNAFKILPRAWGMEEGKLGGLLSELFDAEPEASVATRIDEFVAHTRATTLEAGSRVGGTELLRRYFDHVAPFSESATKKHEFPDAMALLALEDWAREGETQVMLVSRDGDWKRFCEGSEYLCLVEDLGDAFALCNADSGVATVTLFEALAGHKVKGFDEALKGLVDGEFPQLEFEVDAHSYYFYTEELIDVAIRGHLLDIQKGGGTAISSDGTFEVSFHVTVQPEILFSFAFSTQDREGTIPLGSSKIRYTKPVSVVVIGTFDMSGKTPVLERLELVQQSYTLDFGEIAPGFDELTGWSKDA